MSHKIFLIRQFSTLYKINHKGSIIKLPLILYKKDYAERIKIIRLLSNYKKN